MTLYNGLLFSNKKNEALRHAVAWLNSEILYEVKEAKRKRVHIIRFQKID